MTALQLDGVSVRFRLPGAEVRAVRDVSLALTAGELTALVGESGCGKSVLVGALLGLLPANADTAGAAVLTAGGRPVDLLGASERVLAREVRGRRVGLVPQSPASHLTPVRTVGDQLREVVRALRPGADDAAVAVAVAARAGLDAAALGLYPHELSGGMAQRAVTALALVGDPPVLLADEPTSGLDRPLVDRTMSALRGLVDDGRAALLVTHDLAAAARVADVVAVMYAGRVVERGPTAEVLDRPRHPYTAGLVAALPDRDFTPLPGLPPELTALPPGCAFAPRCARVHDRCAGQPPLLRVAPAHDAACHAPHPARVDAPC